MIPFQIRASCYITSNLGRNTLPRGGPLQCWVVTTISGSYYNIQINEIQVDYHTFVDRLKPRINSGNTKSLFIAWLLPKPKMFLHSFHSLLLLKSVPDKLASLGSRGKKNSKSILTLQRNLRGHKEQTFHCSLWFIVATECEPHCALNCLARHLLDTCCLVVLSLVIFCYWHLLAFLRLEKSDKIKAQSTCINRKPYLVLYRFRARSYSYFLLEKPFQPHNFWFFCEKKKKKDNASYSILSAGLHRHSPDRNSRCSCEGCKCYQIQPSWR